MSPSEPELCDVGNGYSVYWPTQNVLVLIEYLAKQPQGLVGEVTITIAEATLCESLRCNLNTEAKTKAIAKKAHESYGLLSLPEWARLVETTCVLVLRRYREGEPLRLLTIDTPVEPLSYQINPLLFRNKPTILFGDGGLGKSSIALLCAMLVATGETVAGLSALRGRVLYLDYEDDVSVHARRLRAIAACHPNLKTAEVRYQAATEPLCNIVHTLLRRVQSERIDFLVIDSLAPATGGDASAEAATKGFKAIRQLNVGTLILAHIPKTNEQEQASSIYGSVFFKNFARSTWELKKEQEVGADELVLGLFNRKSNLSRLHHPIGIRVQQNAEGSAIQYDPCDLRETLELEKGLPVASRIRNFLERDGGMYSAKEIADAIESPLATVKVTLSRQNKTKWHAIGEGRETKWTCLNR